MKRRAFNKLAVLLAGVSLAGLACAQPAKPISLVVGYSAGGSADLVARIVAGEMSKRLGRQVLVENAPGASGMLAAQKVVNAPADGATIYMAGTDTVLVPMVNHRIKLDWEKDFTPIGRMTTVPMVFAVQPESPYNTLSDLIAGLRKTANDSFSFATPGVGTMQHLYGALINKQAQVSMLHVPYKGGAQVANDLVGKQVDSAMLVLSTAMPFIKDGKIKVVSISDTQRAAQLPNVKRIGEETGFNGVALPLWQGLFVKAGTPADVVSSFEKALMEVLKQAEVKTKLQESGITISALPGKEFSAFIKPQAKLYQDIVTAAKITME